jgi:hypothetical protein
MSDVSITLVGSVVLNESLGSTVRLCYNVLEVSSPALGMIRI